MQTQGLCCRALATLHMSSARDRGRSARRLSSLESTLVAAYENFVFGYASSPGPPTHQRNGGTSLVDEFAARSPGRATLHNIRLEFAEHPTQESATFFGDIGGRNQRDAVDRLAVRNHLGGTNLLAGLHRRGYRGR